VRPISKQFPEGKFPAGAVYQYANENAWRSKDPEMEKKDSLLEERVNSLRKAAEVHRQVRKYAQSIVKPGIYLEDMCKQLEAVLKYVIEAEGITAGQAFPTGCSLNHVAAHYSPNPGDRTVLSTLRSPAYNDVCKLDFGTHVNGHLIDSAFTIAFNPQFDPLLQAVQEATNEGVKTAGIDVRLCDVGEAIQEVMESHEVEINGKTYPVVCVRNLCGHSIQPYRIHAGKSVPIVRGGPQTKMEEVAATHAGRAVRDRNLRLHGQRLRARRHGVQPLHERVQRAEGAAQTQVL